MEVFRSFGRVEPDPESIVLKEVHQNAARSPSFSFEVDNHHVLIILEITRRDLRGQSFPPLVVSKVFLDLEEAE